LPGVLAQGGLGVSERYQFEIDYAEFRRAVCRMIPLAESAAYDSPTLLLLALEDHIRHLHATASYYKGQADAARCHCGNPNCPATTPPA
jgi:hypothetical protein